MLHLRTSALLVASLILCPPADGDLIIDLEPRNADGNPTPDGVASGAVMVDILLSVDGEHDPTPDLQMLQLDLGMTATTIEIKQFAWDLDPAVYGFQQNTLPAPSAASVVFGGRAELLSLDGAPTRVATVEITVNGNGTLDVRSPSPLGTATGALFSAGFDAPVQFSSAFGNLRGGTIDVVAPDSPGTDRGDGMDIEDDVQNDPTDAADTGNNRVADLVHDPSRGPTEPIGSASEGNTSPRTGGGFCGIAMLGTFLPSLGGLIALTGCRRCWRRAARAADVPSGTGD